MDIWSGKIQYLVAGSPGDCAQGFLSINRDQTAFILQYPDYLVDYLFQADFPAGWNRSLKTGPWRGKRPDIRYPGMGGRLSGNKSSNTRPSLFLPVSPKAG